MVEPAFNLMSEQWGVTVRLGKAQATGVQANYFQVAEPSSPVKYQHSTKEKTATLTCKIALPDSTTQKARISGNLVSK